MSGVPVARAAGHRVAVPMMREVVAVRHQFDQEYVDRRDRDHATFGLAATPWDEVVAASRRPGAPATA